ncbi:MAG: GntR family transcriptional regulator [Rhizobiaceae bacterium]|nr:GntR family transcriptional regulator [Rhizobiaceae bacterium]
MRAGASHRLRDAIESEILVGELRPGERLDEASIAARFGVSRTPVREALVQLASAGVVELRPHRSAVVATLSPERLVEMFDVMAGLEGLAGKLAARRASKQDMDRLIAAHERCQQAAAKNDADEYYYENEEFHKAIYAASHNEFLAEQCELLHRRLKPYRRMQLRFRNRVATSLNEHEAIVAAIASGDAMRADDVLQQHIRIQGERFGDLIASLAQSAAI